MYHKIQILTQYQWFHGKIVQTLQSFLEEQYNFIVKLMYEQYSILYIT